MRCENNVHTRCKNTFCKLHNLQMFVYFSKSLYVLDKSEPWACRQNATEIHEYLYSHCVRMCSKQSRKLYHCGLNWEGGGVVSKTLLCSVYFFCWRTLCDLLGPINDQMSLFEQFCIKKLSCKYWHFCCRGSSGKY